MSETSSIEWTDSTWNPVTGCTKISPGCKHCYAETFAERWRGIRGHHFEQGFDLRLWSERLKVPLGWKKPRTIFVNSMSDLFHEKIPIPFVKKVFSVMQEAYWHTFQILTKRADRLANIANKLNWSKNIWMGVSVENEQYLWRIDKLRTVPAEVRFISFEPLLGSVSKADLTDIHWAIVGGESGPGARHIDSKWVREIRSLCSKKKTAFFFKQWGGVQKSKTGRMLDGRTWDQMPKQFIIEAVTKTSETFSLFPAFSR